MNFWDHLGEIRRRLLVCIYALGAGCIAGIFAVKPVIVWLAKPVGTLVFLHPTEAFTAQIKIVVGVSFLITLPVILYQLWGFVAVGLHRNEKGYLRWVIPSSYFLFLGGSAFAAFIVFPKAVSFLLTLKSQSLVPMLSIEAYLNFFILITVAFGLLFELPLVLHFLAKIGMLRPEVMTRNRRVSYFLIWLGATLLNPVPEVFTQVLLACAAIGLFEFAVVLVRWEVLRANKL